MKNYCRHPDNGQLLYRCGLEQWTLGDTSPIGLCQFAERDAIRPSCCEYYAMGCCLNREAQIDSDMSLRRSHGRKQATDDNC
jgi:hypothetical protein